jgi:hypothetical protein
MPSTRTGIPLRAIPAGDGYVIHYFTCQSTDFSSTHSVGKQVLPTTAFSLTPSCNLQTSKLPHRATFQLLIISKSNLL